MAVFGTFPPVCVTVYLDNENRSAFAPVIANPRSVVRLTALTLMIWLTELPTLEVIEGLVISVTVSVGAAVTFKVYVAVAAQYPFAEA